MTAANHDSGDEDRRECVDSYCKNCGDPFDRAAEDAAVCRGAAPTGWRPCPKPSPGRPLVDCGVGGHMYTARSQLCS